MTGFFTRLFNSDSKTRDVCLQVLLGGAILGLGVAAFYQIQFSLDQRGLDIDFNFLQETAGYDIEQTLIDYEASDTHSRALMVGATNSLWLAALVILVSSVFAAVTTLARLSKNWVLAVGARCYCNIIRNTPLLLQLSLFLALGLAVLRLLPWSLRGVEPSLGIYFTSRGFYVPWITNLLPLVLVFAAVLALTVILRGKFGRKTFKRLTGISVVVWTLPALMAVAAVAGVFELIPRWDPPVLDRIRINGGVKLERDTIIAVWAFSIYGGVQLSDVLYRHILSLAGTESIASPILGVRKIIATLPDLMPKLLRSAALPILNGYHTVFKNTALAGAVIYFGFQTAGQFSSNQSGRFFEIIFITCGFYLAIGVLFKGLIFWVRSRPAFNDQPTTIYLLPTDREDLPRPKQDTALSWLRANLFYDRLGSLLTISAVVASAYLVTFIWNAAILWSQTIATRFECYSTTESCWVHVATRLRLPSVVNQIMLGFPPPDDSWPAYFVIALFFFVLLFCIYAKVSNRMLLLGVLLTTAIMWFLTFGFLPPAPDPGLRVIGGLRLTLLLFALALVAGFLAGSLLALGPLSRLTLLNFLSRAIINGVNLLPPIIVIGPLVWVTVVFLVPEGWSRDSRFYLGTCGLIAVSAVQFAAVIREALLLGPDFASMTERLFSALRNHIPALTSTAVCQLHYTTFYQSSMGHFDFYSIIRTLGTGADWLSFHIHLTFFGALVYFLISNLIRFAGRRIEARQRASLAS